MKTRTPFGVREFVPEEAQIHRDLVKKTASVFEKNGYHFIRTPTFEYYDTLSEGMETSLKEQAIRFFDNEGHLLVLRPDHTTPIARLVASRMREYPLPLRLYYLAPVFRNPKGDGQEIEIFQAGLELIGSPEPQGDAEIIRICIKTIQALGYKKFGIDIGHSDFLKEIPLKKRDALLKKDYISYGRLPERGGIDLAQDHPSLRSLYRELEKEKLHSYISFNKGLVKDLRYYSGLMFECYIEGFRESVVSGGRYDDLIAKFGKKSPSVGFAINMNSLMKNRLIKTN